MEYSKNVKYRKKLDAKEFLQVVRGECRKGCDHCKFRVPNTDVSFIEKYCAFHNFRTMSDSSLHYLMVMAETFYR